MMFPRVGPAPAPPDPPAADILLLVTADVLLMVTGRMEGEACLLRISEFLVRISEFLLLPVAGCGVVVGLCVFLVDAWRLCVCVCV